MEQHEHSDLILGLEQELDNINWTAARIFEGLKEEDDDQDILENIKKSLM